MMRVPMLIVMLAAVSCQARCSEKKRANAAKVSGAGTPVAVNGANAARTWTRPPAPPSLPSATAWSLAETAHTPEAWDAAAEAYERERASCTTDCADAAYAVVLARKNAIVANPIPPPESEDPVPLPPRASALVASVDEYVRLAPPGDSALYELQFLAANVLNQYHQPDAIVRLEALLRDYHGEPTAEYVANMLLDALVHAGRVAELKQLIAELLADEAFLAGKDDLRKLLLRLQTQIASLQ